MKKHDTTLFMSRGGGRDIMRTSRERKLGTDDKSANSHERAGLLLSPLLFSNGLSGGFGLRLITEEKTWETKLMASNQGRAAVIEPGSGSET